METEVNDRCLFIQFADNQVIILNDQGDMQYMVAKLMEEYREWDLAVDIAKTKYLYVGTQSRNLKLDNSQEILQRQEYDYLGIPFDNTKSYVKENEKQIVRTKRLIGRHKEIMFQFTR